jgi:hypothetical protein
MSENIDGGGRRSPGPRLLVRPLLLFAGVAVVIGFVASLTDVQPYETPFLRLFFSDPLHMKAWLTTAAGIGSAADGRTHLWKTAFPARRPPLSLAASLVRAGGHSAHFAGRYHCNLQARFRDIRCPRLYSLAVGRLFLRRLFRQGPHSPHKRLPRLGAAHGGRGAVRHSYGVVAHFGVLVVRNPRCEPIG